MKTNTLSLLLLLSLLSIAGCKDDDDDGTNNGVPSNTLIAGGTNISLSSTCSTYSSSYNLRLTAADLAQDNVLELNFGDYPTTQQTFVLDHGGSGSEGYGEYTVNGNIVYEIQSGTATVTPVGSGFTITFNNVIAESNGVEITLSFNGTCN